MNSKFFVDPVKFCQIVCNTLFRNVRFIRDNEGAERQPEKTPVKHGLEQTHIGAALTEIDTAVQDFLMEALFAEYPFLVPMVEEDTELKRQYAGNVSDYVVTIDPIDMTDYYIKKKPDYSTIVSLLYQGEIIAIVGFYPHDNSAMVAIKNKGVWVKYPHKIEWLALNQTFPGRKKYIACHYRFVRPPYTALSEPLRQLGYQFFTNETDFGTTLSGVARVLTGHYGAFLSVHGAFYDCTVLPFFIQEAGGVFYKIEYRDAQDLTSWRLAEPRFDDLKPYGQEKRYRVIAAVNNTIIQHFLRDLKRVSATL